MPREYVRPKQISGQLANACQAHDVCPNCIAAGRQVDVPGVLLAAWRAASRPTAGSTEDDGPPAPPLLREHSITIPAPNGRGKTEKAEILDRLRRYREIHGLGCLAAVAQAAGDGITDDTLRDILHGDAVLSLKDWRRIGNALDKMARKEGADG